MRSTRRARTASATAAGTGVTGPSPIRCTRAASRWASAASAAGITEISLRRAVPAAAANGVPRIRCNATAIATASTGVRLTGGRVRARSSA